MRGLNVELLAKLQRAPVGAVLGMWTKTIDGWVTLFGLCWGLQERYARISELDLANTWANNPEVEIRV